MTLGGGPSKGIRCDTGRGTKQGGKMWKCGDTGRGTKQGGKMWKCGDTGRGTKQGDKM